MYNQPHHLPAWFEPRIRDSEPRPFNRDCLYNPYELVPAEHEMMPAALTSTQPPPRLTPSNTNHTPAWKKARYITVLGKPTMDTQLCWNMFDLHSTPYIDSASAIVGADQTVVYDVGWSPCYITATGINTYAANHYHTKATHRSHVKQYQPASWPRCPLYGRGPAAYMRFAEWNNRPETEANLIASHGETHFKYMLTEYSARMRAAGATKSRRDTHLNNLQQQGIWDTPDTPTQLDQPTVHQYIHLDVNNHSPGLDINPTGHYHVQIGCLARNGSCKFDTEVLTYNPIGRVMGCTTIRRLSYLREHYNRHHCHNSTTTVTDTSAFSKDLALLLARHSAQQTARSRSNRLKATTLQQMPRRQLWTLASLYQWTPTDELCDAICNGLFRNTRCVNLYSNPTAVTLQRDTITPHCQYSLSPIAQDHLFGCIHADAMEYTWNTFCYMAVPNCPEIMKMVLKWALASASDPANENSATAIVLLLPCCRDYTSYLPHEAACLLGRVKNSNYIKSYPDSYLHPHTCRHSELVSTPPDGRVLDSYIDVYLVANALGRQRVSTCLEPFWEKFCDMLYSPHGPAADRQEDIRSWLHGTTNPAPPSGSHPLPKAFCQCTRRLTDILTDSAMHAVHTAEQSACLCDHYKRLFSATVATVMDETQGIYTDGSKKTVTDTDGNSSDVCGAAVYRFYSPMVQDCLYVNPNGQGPTNTINRAELSGILAALNKYADEDDIHIYTDSKCSIYQITRALTQPHTTRMSKHQDQLQNIASVLYARALRKQHTHILKIKAHAGLHGNEKADKLATSAFDKFSEPECWTDTSSADPQAKLYWPSGSQANNPNPSTAGRMANLTSAIKSYLRPSTFTGYAKTGQYYDLWTTAWPHLHPKHSHMAFQHRLQGVTHSATRWSFLARWGLLYNQKLAHRWKLASSPLCPLCTNTIDGGGHILGECTTLHHLHIQRHNQSVQNIQSAIESGNFADGTFYMDACAASELPTSVRAKQMPDWICPSHHATKPDIVIIPSIHANSANNPIPASERPLHTIHLIEVGYTNDLGHAAKHAQKTAQHADLTSRLLADGWKCVRHTITLGNTGTIPASLPTTLLALGLDSRAAKKLCSKLHKDALIHVEKIVAVRRHLERAHIKKPP
jgi:ribonuclease HI